MPIDLGARLRALEAQKEDYNTAANDEPIANNPVELPRFGEQGGGVYGQTSFDIPSRKSTQVPFRGRLLL